MKREDPILAQTMSWSKARLQGYEEEAKGERPQGEATEAEGGDTEDEIDRFTLSSKGIPASPP